MGFKITLVEVRKKPSTNINQELKWLGDSLGLFGIRDKDKSCFRLFIELLKQSKLGKPISSDELAQRTDLTRATVIHHLHHLTSCGIIEKLPKQKGYLLKENRLEFLLRMIKSNIDEQFEEMLKTAKEIDERLR